MPLKYYLLALSVCGVHALASAADYDADRAAGHRTLAVAYGRRVAAIAAFATFFVTWLLADFESQSVRVYIEVCALVTLAAAAVPKERVIVTACSVIFVGFLIAATMYASGW
jgi:4-hydroxybenzoate polyprenyltransferase